MSRDDIAGQINTLLHDEYYSTVISTADPQFRPVEQGYIFGTVAVRCGRTYEYRGFLTTSRGKKELSGKVRVFGVDHINLLVSATAKATLNAPLLDALFELNPEVDTIVHYHKQIPGLQTLPYAPPGTKRDTIAADRWVDSSFNIEAHGCFLLLTKDEVVKGTNKTLNDFLETENENGISKN